MGKPSKRIEFIPNEYTVKKIENSLAQKCVIKYHYLHRRCACSYSFGLYHFDELVGVCCFGLPVTDSIRKGVCGKEHREEVIELTRLVLKNKIGKNAESWFVSRCIKLCPYPIIVSYADTAQGHIGYIYQATNFIYTGLSSKHKDWIVLGVDNKHQRHLFEQYGGIKNAKKVLGDKMVQVERPRKHRYIYFNCSKGKRRYYMKLLKYPILPYPKENT